jgi:AcrR family transcriptional regulator
MPTKPLSQLTRTICIARKLRTTVRGLARMLGLSYGTISHYLTHRCRIPVTTADKLRALLLEHAGTFLTPAEKATLETADLAARANAARNQAQPPHSTGYQVPGFIQHRLPKRQKHDPAAARTFAPYRVRQPYSTLLVAALRAWAQVCATRHKQAVSEAHVQDYWLEMADIKALMARVPQDVRGGAAHAFEVAITEAEWGMVSRALRHHARATHLKGVCDGPAYVLYQHWRKYRFAGYPFVPAAVKAERDALVGKLSAG